MNAADLQKLLDAATPGPWRLEQGTTLIWGACIPEDTSNRGMGYPISECRITAISSWAKGPDEDAGEANARLIAAAPDLAHRVIAAEKIVAAYDELLATVRGECSSLLDPCRGGSDVLSFLVDEAETALAEWDATQ